MEWWTAILIGFFGSLHCIGMCGPIAMVIPYHSTSFHHGFLRSGLYNSGRIIGYAAIGILPGLFGQGLYLAGLQKNMALVLGMFLLIMAVFSFGLESRLTSIAIFRSFNQWLQKLLGKFLKQPTNTGVLVTGILNAFIPCGLVYVALAGAVMQQNIWSGALYMGLFGLGTIPLMLGIGLAGPLIGIKWRNYLKRATPIFLILFAALFIFRGLNVNLPIDIQFWIDQGAQPMCH